MYRGIGIDGCYVYARVIRVLYIKRAQPAYYLTNTHEPNQVEAYTDDPTNLICYTKPQEPEHRILRRGYVRCRGRNGCIANNVGIVVGPFYGIEPHK